MRPLVHQEYLVWIMASEPRGLARLIGESEHGLILHGGQTRDKTWLHVERKNPGQTEERTKGLEDAGFTMDVPPTVTGLSLLLPEGNAITMQSQGHAEAVFEAVRRRHRRTMMLAT